MSRSALTGLQILKILRNYADVRHPMRQVDIQRRLENEYENRVCRKALKQHLDDLTIPIDSFVENNHGYYLKPYFTDAELGVMIDDILFAKQIPEEMAKSMIKKLINLSPMNLKGLKHYVDYVPDVNHSQNINVNHFIETIGKAMEKDRKIEVEPCAFNINGELAPIPERTFKADPYSMVCDKNRYYLICGVLRRDVRRVENRRIDRFWKVTITDEMREPITDIEGYEYGLDLPKYMKEHIYMFSGEVRQIHMSVRRDRIGEFFDWYGVDGYSIADGDDKSDFITVRFRANVNAVKYWAVQYDQYVTVLSPDELRKEILEYAVRMAEKYQALGRMDLSDCKKLKKM